MKLTHAKKNSGFTLVELLVVIAIIAGLAAISSPIIIRQIAKARATQALNNAKDIYVGLRDYSFDKGALPTTGTTADDVFQEIFAQGYLQDEKPFYVKGVPGALEGDGDISTPALTLAAGNNVFATTTDGANGINIVTSVASAPVLVTPVVTAGTFVNTTYNAAAFGSQAVVVRADGSAAAYKINPTTYIIPDTTVTTVKAADGTTKTINIVAQELSLDNS